MKRILITGANGFVGKALAARLLRDGQVGDPVGGDPVPFDRLTLVDIGFDAPSDDPRVRQVAGSIADSGVLAEALAEGADGVFHLASIPGGAAEANFELGLDVNLRATIDLFERLRRQPVPARLVFTSTIAVYGSPLPALVDDHSPLRPALSYGAQKLAGEILLQDYGRRGWIDGRILRLPGIVARPPAPSGAPSGLLSAFMSDLFWKLAAGEPVTCPVSEGAVAWWMSVGGCVDNLLHAARLAPERAARRRDHTLPVLRLTIADLVDGLAAAFGEDRRGLVTYAPDPKLEAMFGAFPPLDASASEAAGFHHDGSVAALIRNAMAR